MRARLLAPAAALLVLVAGCGIPSEDSPRAIPSESVSPTSPSPSPSPTMAPGPRQDVNVFLVQDGKLTPVLRRVAEGPGPSALLAALLEGPTEPEKTEGYVSLASVAFPNAEADDRVPPNGIVTVTLKPGADVPADQSAGDKINGYAQIVLTLTADDKVQGVVFVRDNMPVQPPDADGKIIKQGDPVTASDYRSLVQKEPT